MIDGIILDEIKKIEERLQFFNVWMFLIVFLLTSFSFLLELQGHRAQAAAPTTTTTTTTWPTYTYNPADSGFAHQVLTFKEPEKLPPVKFVPSELTVAWPGIDIYYNGSRDYEMGLRSDGVIVWRKHKENDDEKRR